MTRPSNRQTDRSGDVMGLTAGVAGSMQCIRDIIPRDRRPKTDYDLTSPSRLSDAEESVFTSKVWQG